MPARNPIASCPGCADRVVRAALPVEQQCSPCRKKEHHRLWCEANPGANAGNAKRWREAGNKTVRPEGYAEQERVRNRERYQNDSVVKAAAKASAKRQRERLGPEVLKAQHDAWLAINPGKTRQYYLAGLAKLTPEERRQRGKTHRKVYRAQRQADMAAYYARRYGGNGIITNEHLVGLHKWQDHCCFYCREPLKGAETIEHVVPLSRNGSNNPWNVVLVCSACNGSKSDRIYNIEWRPAQVAPILRIHSIEGMRRLRAALTVAGVAYQEQFNYLLIEDRPVFILSSFWLGWAGGDLIQGLKAAYPTAMLFFDKEYEARPEAILNVLKAKAGIAARVGARKLQLAVPTSQEAKAFISRWHAMGFAGGTHYLGLRDVDQWWAIAAFRQGFDNGLNCYQVVRMAIRETVAGGVSRLLSHFRDTMPEKLPFVTFTDQRMGDGKSHFFAGFADAGVTERNFFYATPEAGGFVPRRSFQKQILEARAEYFNPDKTQPENARANGILRVEGLPRLRFAIPV